MTGWPLRELTTLLATAAMPAGSAGCGGAADETRVRHVTTAFFAAIAAHQGRTACGELLPQAAERLRTGDSDCARRIEELDLTGGTILAVRAWGDRAQVKLTGDTVFLVRLPQGWRVAAAGCRPRDKGSYDCDVEA